MIKTLGVSLLALTLGCGGGDADSVSADAFVPLIDAEVSYATVGATWQLVTATGAVATCPPGFDTAALFNVAVDANGTPLAPCTGPGSVSGTCFVDLFNCSDHAGVSSPLPPHAYQTWISITNTTGNNVYAQSLSAFLDVAQVDLDFNASIVTDGGYFSVDWTLEGDVSGNTLSCAQANAPSVDAVVTVSGGSQMIDTNPWDCEDHYGVTSAIPNGVYTVVVEAFSNAGQLGKAPDYTNKTIAGPNGVTDLGSATILIDGL